LQKLNFIGFLDTQLGLGKKNDGFKSLYAIALEQIAGHL